MAKTAFADYLDTVETSAAEAAEALGVSRQYIKALRIGLYTPSLELACKIVSYCQGEIEYHELIKRGISITPSMNDAWEAGATE